MATSSVVKPRKLWTDESMKAAVASVVNETLGLREASRVYNIPVETIRRRVNGSVRMGCKPGPTAVLTDEEEDRLVSYLISMADMGYGIKRDTVMEMAFMIAEKTHKDHPFTEGKAGRAWFEGFLRRHPKLTIRSPQALSYSRAICANRETVDEFFGKLGSIYGRLNLISKPMLIFNCDETGISIVHKPGKVLAELGRRNVYAVTSAERGKTHTILSCVSASGYVLPPMMIYPRKKCVPDKMKEGAVPGTLFRSSESGWINGELYIDWFKFFLQQIPACRPVLLIQDGHASHISIELIELAKANDVHLLCLPSHTTHILQPLDVGVFKSFKSHFSKACTKYLAKHPGVVVTPDMLASLVAEAWPSSFTAVNIMAGFKKTGVYPLNPGEVTDRQLAPSKAVCSQAAVTNSDPPVFSKEKEALYQRRFEEKYDIKDPEYLAWVKLNHPEVNTSSTEGSSVSGSRNSSAKSSDVLSDILLLPEPKEKPSRSKSKGITSAKTVCITEDKVLNELKQKEIDKRKAEEERAAKQLEKARKKKEKQQKEQKRQDKAAKTASVAKDDQQLKAKKKTWTVSFKDVEKETSSTDSDSTTCPLCGMVFADDDTGDFWICCDRCDQWFDRKCTRIRNSRKIPDSYICEKCVKEK